MVPGVSGSLCHISVYAVKMKVFFRRIYALYIWSQVFLLAALWVGDFYSHFTNNETISKKDLKSFTQDQVGKLDFGVHTLSSVSFCVFLVGTLTTARKLTRLFLSLRGITQDWNMKSSLTLPVNYFTNIYWVLLQARHRHKEIQNIMPAVRKYSSICGLGY